ncbi:MAG: hypothetical protein ACTH04_03805, partial [Halomonadaceae bacterium]
LSLDMAMMGELSAQAHGKPAASSVRGTNMKSIPISLTCVLALAGCQVVPDRLPQADPAPAASCYFSIDTPSNALATQKTSLETSVDVLTEWGFTLNSTDTALGLISASRERALHGYYDRYDNAYGYGRDMRVFGGLGIGRGSGIGFGIGGGFGGGIGQQPVEVERVSLLVNDTDIRISRDIRRFDHVGDLRESYSASNDDFCRRFQTSYEQSMPATGSPL